MIHRFVREALAGKARSRTRSTGGFSLTNFVAGFVVGCLALILVAAVGVPMLDDYQPDTVAFPDIDTSAVQYEYEFPDILESTREREPSEVPVRELVTVEETDETAPVQTVAPPIESFLLQAGSFEQQRHADVFRASLVLRGYQAKTTAVDVPGIGPRYRVVVGPFPSQAEAQAAIDRLDSEQVRAILLGIRET
ncbi:MAG: SPOR domain-containing protein [Gammaproteobacteria bacterium]|nr:SPOR domain-containing protein [Gammaproteobacteria bacterium]